jgi:hypothetical protein
MVQNLVFPDMHGIPGKLFPINSQVVPALKPGVHAHLLQYFQDWQGVFPEINQVFPFCLLRKCEIQVTQVMKHSSSARKAPDNLQPSPLHYFLVDLCQSVLMLPDDDRGFISPEGKGVPRKIFQDVFFCGKIETGIRGIPPDDQHEGMFMQNYLFFRVFILLQAGKIPYEPTLLLPVSVLSFPL